MDLGRRKMFAAGCGFVGRVTSYWINALLPAGALGAIVLLINCTANTIRF